MAIPLSNRRRWQFASGVAFLGCVYLVLAGTEFAASAFASRAELPALQRAVRLSPGNADYRHRLGRYYAFVASDSPSAIESFDQPSLSIHMMPAIGSIWPPHTGNRRCRRTTSSAEPCVKGRTHRPNVAWEAANFFLIDGDIDRALREFRVVIENDNNFATLPWRRVGGCVPMRTPFSKRGARPHRFPDFLFNPLTTSSKPRPPSRPGTGSPNYIKSSRPIFVQYVRYLISVHRPEAAMAAWEPRPTH